MPKDPQKNKYLQVGIAWDSWTLAQLEADAKLHQMEEHMAKLLVIRLTEYYRLVEKGMVVPGITAMMQPVQVSNNGHSNGHSNGYSNGTGNRGGSNAATPAQEEEQSTSTVTESENAEENADAALDFFMMDEEE